MKFGVVIPTLNEEKYVGGILTDLTNQTHKNFEVTVVDGDSTDRTVEVVNGFNKKLVVTVVKTKVRNQAWQRNEGAKLAKSNHLVFFDADTRIDANFFKTLAQAVFQNKFDFATSELVPEGKRWYDQLAFKCHGVYLRMQKLGVGAFMYICKTAFASSGGFAEDIKIFEDAEFFNRLGKLGYRYQWLKEPKISFSVRRLNKEGRLHYFSKIIKGGILFHLGKDLRKGIAPIEYNYGKF